MGRQYEDGKMKKWGVRIPQRNRNMTFFAEKTRSQSERIVLFSRMLTVTGNPKILFSCLGRNFHLCLPAPACFLLNRTYEDGMMQLINRCECNFFVITASRRWHFAALNKWPERTCIVNTCDEIRLALFQFCYVIPKAGDNLQYGNIV